MLPTSLQLLSENKHFYTAFSGYKGTVWKYSVSTDLQCHLAPILLIIYYNVALQQNYNGIFVAMHMTVAVISHASIKIGIIMMNMKLFH